MSNSNAFYIDGSLGFGSKLIFGLIDLDPIAIGTIQYPEHQSDCAIAIGKYAGIYTQGECAIAIGEYAGHTEQGNFGIAIGAGAGSNLQSELAIAMGSEAGFEQQSTRAIAIGTEAGMENQGENALALGFESGKVYQSSNAIALGYASGYQSQGNMGIAIGTVAGEYNQGEKAIAIGFGAGQTNQPANSIVLNASNNPLSGTTSSSCYVSPIRLADDYSPTQTQSLVYDISSKEVMYQPSVLSVGDIKFSVQSTNHNNWLLCNGQSVLVADYPKLHAVIGYAFGGAGASFNLPDSRSRVLGAIGQGVGLSNRTLGLNVGAESVTLTQAQMPSHTHTGTTDSAGAHTHSSNAVGGQGNLGLCLANGANTVIDTDSSLNELNVWTTPYALTINSDGTHTHTFTTGSTGSGQSHENMQPTLFIGNVFIYAGY